MKYNAFISYSHSQNTDLAVNLEKALEKFAKPTFKRRALDIFRDSNDLSVSPDLWGKIEEGLAQSEYFIYFASPKSANSYYCNEEVKYWLENKSIDNFLVILTDGDIKWDFKNFDFDWNETTAMSQMLTSAFKNEPLYVDFRDNTRADLLNLDNPDFKTKVVLIAATLHGKAVGDMVGEAVKQHKRTLMIRNGAVAIVMALMSLTIALTMISNRRKSASLLHFQAKSIESTNPTLALRLEQEALKIHDYPEFERSAFAIINRNSFYQIIATKDTASFTAMDISKNHTLLLASNDGSISLSNKEGVLIRELNIDRGKILAAKFAPDGQSILTGSEKGGHLWDLNGRLKSEFKPDTPEDIDYRIAAVAFSSNGKTVLTGSNMGAYLWDLDGNRILGFEIVGAIKSVAFAPDGNSVLIGYDGAKYAANLFDLQGNTLATFSTNDPNYGEPYTITNTVAFSKDGQTIMVCSSVNNIQLFDLEGNLKDDFDLPDLVNFEEGTWSASFSPDGTKILTCSFENTASLWDLNGMLIKEFKGHEGMINLVAFDPIDDKTVYTGSVDKTIRKWYTEGLNATISKEFSIGKNPISSIDMAPDNKSVLTSSQDSSAYIWDFNGKLIKTFNHENRVNKAVFAPDGQSILTSTPKGLHVWNLNGDLLQEHFLTDELIGSMAFTSDGKSIQFGSKLEPKPADYLPWLLNGIHTWDWQENSIKELKIEHKEATSVRFATDGKTILTGSKVGAHLWNLQGDSMQEFKLRDEKVSPVAIAPYGTSVLTEPASLGLKIFSNTYGKSHLWNMEGELVQEYKLNRESVDPRAFAPDGKYILTLSYPKLNPWDKGSPTARVWDLEGNIFLKLHRPGKDITSISFSPDGKFLIAVYRNGTNRLLYENKECTLVIYNKIELEEFLQTHVSPLSKEQKKEFNIN